MSKITRVITISRPIDLPGLSEPMPAGDYKLVFAVEEDPIDDRQVYYHAGEATRIEDDRCYPLWGHQIETLLRCPQVTTAEPVPTS